MHMLPLCKAVTDMPQEQLLSIPSLRTTLGYRSALTQNYALKELHIANARPMLNAVGPPDRYKSKHFCSSVAL